MRFPHHLAAAAAIASTALMATTWTAQAAALRETLQQSGQFNTLAKILGATENADWFVKENEQYTLFAPTDAAFSKLPPEVLQALLKPENRTALNAILEHHVIPDQQVTASQLKNGQTLDPAFGMDYTVKISGNQVGIGTASVVKPDIRTDQGIVHAIDAVLIPDLVTDALKQRGVLKGQ